MWINQKTENVIKPVYKKLFCINTQTPPNKLKSTDCLKNQRCKLEKWLLVSITNHTTIKLHNFYNKSNIKLPISDSSSLDTSSSSWSKRFSSREIICNWLWKIDFITTNFRCKLVRSRLTTNEVRAYWNMQLRPVDYAGKCRLRHFKRLFCTLELPLSLLDSL